MPEMIHVICERDVGLFSLIQQVIAHIPWAVSENRIPIVLFGNRCCYWTPNEYANRDSVWEYYFKPVVSSHPANSITASTRAALVEKFPNPFSVGNMLDRSVFVSSHYGDHEELKGKTLTIPYLWDDPTHELRCMASEIIQDHIRPRTYLQTKVSEFWEKNLASNYVIGVHVRGTDAVATNEIRAHRYGSLKLKNYVRAIQQLLEHEPNAKILVATDAQKSLDYLKGKFADRVFAYGSLRHEEGEATGCGPDGWNMPAYIAGDRDRAAQNGEEAVIEYLLLCRCQHLVHNSSSLARTVLLAAPAMMHTNTHRKNRSVARIQAYGRYKMNQARKLIMRMVARLKG